MNRSAFALGKDRQEALGKALRASLIAGDAILKVYTTQIEVCYKSDRSPLTEADRQSHEILASHLSGEIPLLSEEGLQIAFEERKNWDLFWLIDPLDGTKEFIKRNGEFTVNVALIEKNSPVLGIVYLPAKREFFFGGKGFGAYRVKDAAIDTLKDLGSKPGRILQAAFDRAALLLGHRVNMPGGISIVQSISHMTPEESGFIDRLNGVVGNIEAVSAGSSLKFCRVAEGCADIYPRFGPTMEWDTAAGQCIAESAGGEVLDISGLSRMRYNKRVLLNNPFVVLGARIKARESWRDIVLECAQASLPVHGP